MTRAVRLDAWVALVALAIMFVLAMGAAGAIVSQ